MQHTEEEVPYQHDSASSMEYEKRENEDMIRTILNEEDEAVVPSKNEPNETEEEEIISYEEALTRIGFGPFQLMMMHICGAGSMVSLRSSCCTNLYSLMELNCPLCPSSFQAFVPIGSFHQQNLVPWEVLSSLE